MMDCLGLKLSIGVLCAASLLVASGCTKREDKLTPFDGHYFKAKIKPVDKKASRADFTTTIWAVSQSLDGARQAGHYEGTKYCIAQYGSSKINWAVGPDTAPENLTIVDDTLTFAGRCEP
jgi:hypothetical protein